MMNLSIGSLLLWIGALFVLYIVGSVLIPPLFIPKISGEYEDKISKIKENPPVSNVERVLCIDDNMDALIWRLRVIQAAQKEIVLATFDFGDDNSGRDIMAELLHAAERGVKVKVLVDGINGFFSLGGSRHFKALISSPNVEAEIYNPICLLKPWKINYRMHDKYLVADDMVYILGGRNTNNLFLGSYADKYNIDRDMLVYETTAQKDTSLWQIKNYFQTIWSLSDCKRLNSNKKSKKVCVAKAELLLRHEDLKLDFPQGFSVTDWERETFPAKGITLLSNAVAVKNKAPELWYAVCQIMKEAQEIVIQTPYIICNQHMYKEMAAWCAGKKRVRIVTNAVENGANPFGCTDYLNQKNRILRSGTEVYEYLGEQSLHIKTILMDQNISFAGSLNLDMRSVYLNTETMLLIDCPQLNEQLNKKMESITVFCKHILPDGAATHGEEYKEVSWSFAQHIQYSILRIILFPMRHLL